MGAAGLCTVLSQGALGDGRTDGEEKAGPLRGVRADLGASAGKPKRLELKLLRIAHKITW